MNKPSRAQKITSGIFIAFITYLTAVAILTPNGTLDSLHSKNVTAEDEPLSYNKIIELSKSDTIDKAYFYDYNLILEDKDGNTTRYQPGLGFVITEAVTNLSSNGIDVVFDAPPSGSASSTSVPERYASAFKEFFSFLLLLLPIAILVMVSTLIYRSMGTPNNRVAKKTAIPTVSFEDVAGYAEVKNELREVGTFMKNPEDFLKVSAKAPKGVLLIGPPGTGKTLLAKALANDVGASFIATTGSDFSSMFVGQGGSKVRKLFATAKKNLPAVIFIDEIDSVARRRGGDGSHVSAEKDTILNTLLTEMDGFENNEGITIVAATNRVDVLDPALLRPGRFDRHVYVGPPDRNGREEAFFIHTKGKPLAEDVDIKEIAKGTPGFTGADIANLVNEAAVLAGREKSELITAKHFELARDKVVMGVERKSATLDDDERRLVAHHEAGHAIAACLIPGATPVHQATIIPRGHALGFVMMLPEKDRICVPKSKLEADIVVSMAGRAAEAVFFNEEHVTTGAAGDIQQATEIATKMVCEWGMSSLGMVRIKPKFDGSLPQDANDEIRRIVEDGYQKALTCIKTNRERTEKLAIKLLDSETLTGDEVREIANG